MSNPNRYPGNCVKCGERVGAGAGLLVKVDGKFGVEHGECPTTTTAPKATPRATFAPTAEQQECIDLFLSGASMVIEAGAGTGKTSTLRLLAEAAPAKQILYVAYNKAIVNDVAGSMPRNVRASTAHSLAWQAGGKAFKSRLDKGRQRRREIASHLGIDAPMAFKQEDGAPPKMLSPEQLAGTVMTALSRFCQTAEERPGPEHFPYVEKIDITVDGVRRWENNLRLRSEMVPVLERAWADVLNPDGWLRYSHDFYLKRYQLSHPRLAVDVVMLDEAQDADPVIAAIVEEQTHAQRVYVGDENQQIYEWRGAVNALAKFDTDHRGRLTKSFRFGPTVAAEANEILVQLPTDMRIVGHDPIRSVVRELADGEADAVLCRTNARAIEEVMQAMGRGERPYLVGGGREIAAFARAAVDLMAGRSTEHPELSCFDSWTQVVEFVEQDEQGDELRLLVNLVESFGASTILAAIDAMTDERNATVTISTAHKAKGREWSKVRIASDFMPRPDKPLEDSDLRLRYVAFTRARDVLDNTCLTADSDPTPTKERTMPTEPTEAPAEDPEARTCAECDGPVTWCEARTNSETGAVRSGRWVHAHGPYGWAFDQPDGTIRHAAPATEEARS